MTTQDFLWLALGIAALIVALGIAFVCLRLGKVLDRTQETLAKAQRLLDDVEPSISASLDHVGGVMGNVDTMVTRVNRVTELLERVINSVAKAADAAQAAVTPTVANVVGIVAGVSKGAQAFFRGHKDNGSA